MKRSISLALALLGIVHMSLQAAPEATPSAEQRESMRLLLITGRDVAAHDWRSTTPVLREHLEKTGRIEVVVSEEPLVLESSALENYDVVMFNYYNHQRPGLTEKAQDNLRRFVAGGKGLVSFHYSCRAFEDWPEFRKMVGRVWVGGHSGHGPRGEFEVKVRDNVGGGEDGGHFRGTRGTKVRSADGGLSGSVCGG
jgi:uncharacterized protein